jgi:hypothetical protein
MGLEVRVNGETITFDDVVGGSVTIEVTGPHTVQQGQHREREEPDRTTLKLVYADDPDVQRHIEVAGSVTERS